MYEITDNFISAVATDIEKILLEKREIITRAFKKIPDDMKISIGVNLEESNIGVAVNYTVSIPLSSEPWLRETVEYKHIIDETQ